MRFRRVLALSSALFASVAFSIGCASSSGPYNGNAPANTAPAITSVTPAAITTGSIAATLAVTGSGFVQGSEVQWGSQALATLYVSPSALQAPLSSSQIQTAGTFQVMVVNPPAEGSLSSNSMPVVISGSLTPNPAPTLIALNPASAVTGSAALTLTVTGTNFVSTSTINWNGAALSTSYVNSTTLTTTIPQTDLASAGSSAVTVTNPAPGGGTSSSASFLVNAAGTSGQVVINAVANDLAWDPVNQVIYLSLPSTDGANGNSVQILDPVKDNSEPLYLPAVNQICSQFQATASISMSA